MRVECPSCLARLKVGDQHAGRRFKCPKCGEPVTARNADEPQSIEEFLDDDEFEDYDPPATAPRSRGRAKRQTCPMCGGKNALSAESCEFCGEELDGLDDSGRPSDRGAGIWRDGKQLVMRKTAQLPKRCVKTNEPTERWLRRKMYWHHPAVFISLLGGVLIYAILALILRKSADIKIGLSDGAYRRRWTAIVVGWLVGLGSIGVVVLGFANSGPNQPESYLLLIPLGILGGAIGIAVSASIAGCVSPTKITENFVWLKGVHPDYLAALPEWSDDE